MLKFTSVKCVLKNSHGDNCQKAMPMSKEQVTFLGKKTNHLVKMKMLEICLKGLHASPILIVPKKSNEHRLVIDIWLLEKYTKRTVLESSNLGNKFNKNFGAKSFNCFNPFSSLDFELAFRWREIIYNFIRLRPHV